MKNRSFSDQENYYLNHLIKHEQAKKSKISPLGIHHKHLDDYIKNEIIKLPPNSIILDAGCGINAWPTKRMRKKYNIEGIDGEPDAVSFCKKQYTGKFIHGDLYNMPYRTNSFNVVVMREVIEHFINPEIAVKEIRRILKPSGLFIATTPNYDSLKLKLIENTYNRYFGGECKPYRDDVHPSKFKFIMLSDLISKYFIILNHKTIDIGISQGITAENRKRK